MSAISHEASRVVPDGRSWFTRVGREMWAGLTIAVMWLAVLFASVFGPNFVSTSAAGTSTTVPSAVFVALFAWLATRVVARYGFGQRREDGD